MAARVRSVNVGLDRPASFARIGRTAIDKRPVSGRVLAGPLGLEGDAQANRRHHGGPDQAVYAFAREDLDRWAEELGRDLRDGIFGENLTTVGLDLAAAVIGERWRIGAAEVEVAGPRVPCQTFQGYLGEPRWVKRFTVDTRSGAYLRVLGPGELGAGDEITLLSRPDHGVTTEVVFRALLTEPALLPRLLAAPQLPAKVLEAARAYVARSRSA